MKKLLSCFLFGLVLLSQTILADAEKAPAINLPGINGQVNLNDLEGKVVYLDFWASWCKPCMKSFPWMHDMKQRYADKGLEVIAVNLDKERKLADDFLEKVDVNFLVAFDAEGKTAEAYQLQGMPSSYFIGRDGKIHASHIGFREKDVDKMEQALKQLLNK